MLADKLTDSEADAFDCAEKGMHAKSSSAALAVGFRQHQDEDMSDLASQAVSDDLQTWLIAQGLKRCDACNLNMCHSCM